MYFQFRAWKIVTILCMFYAELVERFTYLTSLVLHMMSSFQLMKIESSSASVIRPDAAIGFLNA